VPQCHPVSIANTFVSTNALVLVRQIQPAVGVCYMSRIYVDGILHLPLHHVEALKSMDLAEQDGEMLCGNSARITSSA
jgi:hypothetical protein